MANHQPISAKPNSPKRPRSVTFLTWMVLIIASLNWLQLLEVVRLWDFLQNLSQDLPVLYLAITGLIWGLIGVCLVWGLFLGRSWAHRLMKITALVYAIFYWIDRLWIADFSTIGNRWPFALGLTIILLIFTFWVLSRSKTRNFFAQT